MILVPNHELFLRSRKFRHPKTRLQKIINTSTEMKKYKPSDFQQWKKLNIGNKTIKQYFSKKLKKEVTKEMLSAT